MLKRMVLFLGATVLGATAWGGVTDFDAGASLVARGFFLTWLIVFVAGVLVSFTPCVYPMIPITLSIIGARSAEQKPLQGFLRSLVFVLGLAVVYTALGYIGAKTGKLVGFMLQSKWFLGFLTLFFLAMGASMLGLFEIQLPPAVASRLQGKAGRGGYVGAFLLGIVTGIVASPCGSPVLFSVLTLATQSGQELVGMLLLFAYALGIGMLFLVLGTFPSFLRAMPKSGSWMEDVRIFLGLLLIAVAIGYYAGLLLAGPVHQVLVGVSALAGVVYILWRMRRNPQQPVALRRFWFAVSALLAAAAVWAGAKAIVLRPDGVSPKEKEVVQATMKATGSPISTASVLAETTVSAKSHASEAAPAATEADGWLTDEAEALRRAKAENKPVLIDFRADWCAACKELEKKTFPHPAVAPLLVNFIKVKIDATEETDENAALRQKYGALALPTVAFVRPDGTLAAEFTLRKFEEPEKFAERVKNFLGTGAKAP
ncbi:MAG: thioredoxin family protein [Candidatus Sumerlaeaceae bacterium]|nr:thioredoxin family protein [Candidatus Sumerlaeaceae bacterium]